MSKARMILLTILAFLGSMVAGYFIVMFGFLGAWEVMGIHDRDGGGAMAVGLIFAPIGALIAGIAGAVWAASVLARKRADAPSPAPLAEPGDAKFVVRLLCAVAGFVVGWQVAGMVQYWLGAYAGESMVAAIAYVGISYVLPIAFAVAGYFLAGPKRPAAD